MYNRQFEVIILVATDNGRIGLHHKIHLSLNKDLCFSTNFIIHYHPSSSIIIIIIIISVYLTEIQGNCFFRKLYLLTLHFFPTPCDVRTVHPAIFFTASPRCIAFVVGSPGRVEQKVVSKKNIPRDPGSPCQMMIGVYNHLRNARFLSSMKPFSEGDWIPRACVQCLEKTGCVFLPKNKICTIHGWFRSPVPRKDACDTLTSSISRVHVNRCYISGWSPTRKPPKNSRKG